MLVQVLFSFPMNNEYLKNGCSKKGDNFFVMLNAFEISTHLVNLQRLTGLKGMIEYGKKRFRNELE